MTKYKAHPYANLFPMMTAAELEALTEDVKANGLQQAIVLYNGTVLDGRNRLQACEAAGVEPSFMTHEGDAGTALALVLSLNASRRELTKAQRAIVAARTLPEYQGPKLAPGRVYERLALIFGVSTGYIKQARALLDEAADLADQVVECTLSLAGAYAELDKRRKETAFKQRHTAHVAKFKEAIEAGEMTFEEAMAKAVQEERDAKEEIVNDGHARRGFHKMLEEAVSEIMEWTARQPDDRIAWYIQAGSLGSEHEMTAERIDAAVAQLNRVRSAFFGGSNGHVKERGGKARSARA